MDIGAVPLNVKVGNATNIWGEGTWPGPAVTPFRIRSRPSMV